MAAKYMKFKTCRGPQGLGFKSQILMLIFDGYPFIVERQRKSGVLLNLLCCGWCKNPPGPLKPSEKNVTLSQLEVPLFCMKQVGESFFLHSMKGERRCPVFL